MYYDTVREEEHLSADIERLRSRSRLYGTPDLRARCARSLLRLLAAEKQDALSRLRHQRTHGTA